ncbi:hypothetical protein NDU88_004333 [Pleurodeles waltl]|uniref:Uncharacterized protein n=1 Tax=Pleurodeles waltl TaxID=8319 RepID=A0AAV7MT57_PLEWA|nr:hypothetical protein NDU88_004333 [Pleurodeles waltl]
MARAARASIGKARRSNPGWHARAGMEGEEDKRRELGMRGMHRIMSWDRESKEDMQSRAGDTPKADPKRVLMRTQRCVCDRHLKLSAENLQKVSDNLKRC